MDAHVRGEPGSSGTAGAHQATRVISAARKAALIAEPDTDRGEELIETLTEREGIPYNQSWALRALGRILDLNGSSRVSSRSVAMLTGMRDGLRPGSSRQLMLTDLVDRLTRPGNPG
jgi:hypothetical protein